MNIVVCDINDVQWDTFIEENAEIDGYWYYSSWLKFLDSYGLKIEKFCIYNDDRCLVGLFYIEVIKLKFARFGYIRGGPVVKKLLSNFEYEKFKNFLAHKSKQLNLHTIRIDFIKNFNTIDNLNLINHFYKSYAVGLPRYFGVIDLEVDENLMWNKVSSSSKNNINKGKRIGFKIAEITDVELIYKLLRETAFDKKFTLPPIDYFRKQQEILPKGFINFFSLSLNDRLLSVAVIHKSNKSVFYTYGGSTKDPTLSKYRSQYYLQWYLVTKFKKEGFKEYNMWGVLKDQKSSDLSGVSAFKKNLGAKIKYENTLLEYRRSGVGLLKQIIYDFIVYKKDRI